MVCVSLGQGSGLKGDRDRGGDMGTEWTDGRLDLALSCQRSAKISNEEGEQTIATSPYFV